MTAARERLGRGCRESRGDRSESSTPRAARSSQRSARCARQNVVTATVVTFAAFVCAFVDAQVTWVRQLNRIELRETRQSQRGGAHVFFTPLETTLDWTTGRIDVRMTLTLIFSCIFFVDAHSRWMTRVPQRSSLPVTTLRETPSSQSTPHRHRRGARKSPSTVPTRRPKGALPYARLWMRTSYRLFTPNQEVQATITSSFAVMAELTRLVRLRLLTRRSIIHRRPSSATSAPRKLLTAQRWLQIMGRTKRRFQAWRPAWTPSQQRRLLLSSTVRLSRVTLTVLAHQRTC